MNATTAAAMNVVMDWRNETINTTTTTILPSIDNTTTTILDVVMGLVNETINTTATTLASSSTNEEEEFLWEEEDMTSTYVTSAVDSPYNFNQQVTIAILPKITSLLSLIGSICVILEVLADQRQTKRTPRYSATTSSLTLNTQQGGTSGGAAGGSGDNSNNNSNSNLGVKPTSTRLPPPQPPSSKRRNYSSINRILLSMSIADIIFSIGWFLGVLPSPQETTSEYQWGAIGNTATCTMQGFLMQFGWTSGPLFNLTLSLYYVLIIRYNWKEDDLKSLDRYIQISIWLLALILATIPIPFQLYNNSYEVCWIDTYPLHCDREFSSDEEVVECSRGNDTTWIYGLILSSIFPSYLCMILSVVFMSIIYYNVRAMEDRNLKWMLKSTGGNGENTNEDTTRIRARSTRVRSQAVLFIGAFYVAFLPDAISKALYLLKGRSYFGLNLIAHGICMPIQGMLNCLVFLRQREIMKSRLGIFIHKLICRSCCYNIPALTPKSIFQTIELSTLLGDQITPNLKELRKSISVSVDASIDFVQRNVTSGMETSIDLVQRSVSTSVDVVSRSVSTSVDVVSRSVSTGVDAISTGVDTIQRRVSTSVDSIQRAALSLSQHSGLGSDSFHNSFHGGGGGATNRRSSFNFVNRRRSTTNLSSHSRGSLFGSSIGSLDSSSVASFGDEDEENNGNDNMEESIVLNDEDDEDEFELNDLNFHPTLRKNNYSTIQEETSMCYDKSSDGLHIHDDKSVDSSSNHDLRVKDGKDDDEKTHDEDNENDKNADGDTTAVEKKHDGNDVVVLVMDDDDVDVDDETDGDERDTTKLEADNSDNDNHNEDIESNRIIPPKEAISNLDEEEYHIVSNINIREQQKPATTTVNKERNMTSNIGADVHINDIHDDTEKEDMEEAKSKVVPLKDQDYALNDTIRQSSTSPSASSSVRSVVEVLNDAMELTTTSTTSIKSPPATIASNPEDVTSTTTTSFDEGGDEVLEVGDSTQDHCPKDEIISQPQDSEEHGMPSTSKAKMITTTAGLEDKKIDGIVTGTVDVVSSLPTSRNNALW